ncbi:hypothetical protein AYO46_02555 [Betaproteobacteria bacterium SCGC AG-212-J23]|nr:hypothetical protein AYO46_02555 [Betaproteobacteria bacterium SCGC AG-212-J23]
MKFPAGKRSQTGVTLLVMTVILGMGILAFMLAALNAGARNESTLVRNRNAEVLAQAKAAVLGYIAKEVLDLSGNDIPGRLPCPESTGTAGTAGEGITAGNCAPTYPSNKSVGRLPWRTLGIDRLVDASAEPLWYAVSPNWVLTAGGSPLINIGTTGQLTFDGTADVVAVIFAPGRPISSTPTAAQIGAGCVARNQTRADRTHVAAGGDPDYRDYLECQNGSAPIDAAFGVDITGNESNLVINDQAVVITSKDVLNAIQGPVAERLQRTVAPLLSEFADTWITGSKFMPYAVTFSPPEAGLALNSHCGSGGVNEGLLPIAPNAAPCSSQWSGTTLSGDGIDSLGCSAATASDPVICSFRYYRFTALGQFILGLTGSGSVTASGQASAPHAAASFRAPIAQSDITVTAGAATIGGFSLVPQASGDADLAFTATVTAPNICKDSLLGGLLCSTLSGLLVTNATVTLQYPQLGMASLAGTRLTNAAKNGHAGPFDLLNPIAGDPHFWFVQNEWYRYTYYALAPSASAAQTVGSHLVVNGFPTANGATNDKRFVLAVMGLATTGQTRSSTAALSQYVEGANAVTTTSPRAFAYTVYGASGNDRIATCPFTDGVTPCN